MDKTVEVSNTDWKAIGITAAVVAVVGVIATIATMEAYKGYSKWSAKRASEKEKDATKKV